MAAAARQAQGGAAACAPGRGGNASARRVAAPQRRTPAAARGRSGGAGFGAPPAPPPSASETSDAATRAFAAWCASAGVESSKLDLRSGGGAAGGRGTFAAARVRRGEPIVELPRSAVLHVVEGEPSAAPELCADAAWARLPWQAQLALALVAERRKGAASRFAAYVDTLPRVSARAPRLPRRVLEAACYPPLAADVANEAEATAAWLRAARESGAPDARTLSRDEFEWALDCVFSRAFSGGLGREVAKAPLAARAAVAGLGVFAAGNEALPEPVRAVGAALAAVLVAKDLLGDDEADGGDGEGGDGGDARMCYGLFPMVDAINHRTRSATRLEHSGSSDAFTLRADADCEQGQEYLHSYGRLSNDVLAMRYGFVEVRVLFCVLLAAVLCAATTFVRCCTSARAAARAQFPRDPDTRRPAGCASPPSAHCVRQRDNPADVYIFEDFEARLPDPPSGSESTSESYSASARARVPQRATLGRDGELDAPADALLCAACGGDAAKARDMLLSAVRTEAAAFSRAMDIAEGREAAKEGGGEEGEGGEEGVAMVRAFRAEKAAVLRDAAAAVERGERTYGRKVGRTKF